MDLTAEYLAATIADQLAQPGDRIKFHTDECEHRAEVVKDADGRNISVQTAACTCTPIVLHVGVRGAA